jgi:hypothetical protein
MPLKPSARGLASQHGNAGDFGEEEAVVLGREDIWWCNL